MFDPQILEIIEEMLNLCIAAQATPEQVKSVAIECLNATMDMGTDQIKYLAEEINKAIGM